MIRYDGDHNFTGKLKMVRKPKEPHGFEYLAEKLVEDKLTTADSGAAIIARMNELGLQGWELVTITEPFAWFIRSF